MLEYAAAVYPVHALLVAGVKGMHTRPILSEQTLVAHSMQAVLSCCFPVRPRFEKTWNLHRYLGLDIRKEIPHDSCAFSDTTEVSLCPTISWDQFEFHLRPCLSFTCVHVVEQHQAVQRPEN